MAKSKEGFISLTKAENEVMNYLWDRNEPSSVHDLIDLYPDPKPAYTTIATFMTILGKKGFVKQEKLENRGKTLFFSPLMSREKYTSRIMENVKDSFFHGSAKSLVSFFCKEEKLTVDDVRELLQMVENQ